MRVQGILVERRAGDAGDRQYRAEVLADDTPERAGALAIGDRPADGGRLVREEVGPLEVQIQRPSGLISAHIAFLICTGSRLT